MLYDTQIQKPESRKSNDKPLMRKTFVITQSNRKIRISVSEALANKCLNDERFDIDAIDSLCVQTCGELW
jgi:hypothetical protein